MNLLSTSDSSSGNGIGLAIVKKIVELHKGVVEVNSAINQGTTFKLIFRR
ncbi:MAG: ATP-binding protein [Bacteroidales bacterium]